MGAEVENAGLGHEAVSHVAPLPRISVQAFCDSDSLISLIENAASDRRMSKAHVKVMKGGMTAALEAFKSAATPNLIVLKSPNSRSDLLSQLEILADYCDPGTKVVVIGYENDIALYRDLTNRGVSDYIVEPASVMEFIERISLLYANASVTALGRTVAVIGAKGGVGSSTIAQNVAWSISQEFEMETVIADLDLAFGTVALNFNQEPSQGISEAIFSPDRLDAQFLDGLLWRCSDHLSILAAPASLDRIYDFDEYAFDATIEMLTSIVPWSILDVPHGWNGWIRRVLLNVDEVIIVASPDLSNLRHTKALVDNLRSARPNDAPPQVILNMVSMPRRPEVSLREFSRAIGLDVVAEIPFDPKIFGVASNNGQMLEEVGSATHIVEKIDDIARVIAHREKRQGRKTSLFGKMIDRLVSRKAN